MVRLVADSPGTDRCMPAISTLQTIFVMVMNTITDFYLMAIPLPVRIEISRR